MGSLALRKGKLLSVACPISRSNLFQLSSWDHSKAIVAEKGIAFEGPRTGCHSQLGGLSVCQSKNVGRVCWDEEVTLKKWMKWDRRGPKLFNCSCPSFGTCTDMLLNLSPLAAKWLDGVAFVTLGGFLPLTF
jgi:hypothetical protein